MSDSKFFSGPPSNKATASTLAAAVSTLFWTIAAHTFWKTMSTDDLTLYITTSTVLVTAIIGFAVPESAAFTDHNARRLAAPSAAPSGAPASPATPASQPAIAVLEARVQGLQDRQNLIETHLGITPPLAIPTPGK